MRSPSPIPWLLLGLIGAGCVTAGGPGGGGPLEGQGGDAGDPARAVDGGSCPAPCDPLDCPGGYHPGGLPGDCCPAQCLPDDCTLDDCVPLECPTGSREVVPPGECCPVCAASALPGVSCDEGRAAYEEVRAALIDELDATRCEVDAECRAVSLRNACDSSCALGLRGAAATAVEQRLLAEARVRCAACEEPAPSCPPASAVAYCAGGRCAAR